MSYTPATPGELNALFNDNRAAQIEPTSELSVVLSLPPERFSTVLLWADDLELNPTQEHWDEARELPTETTLREILLFLGADPAAVEAMGAGR